MEKIHLPFNMANLTKESVKWHKALSLRGNNFNCILRFSFIHLPKKIVRVQCVADGHNRGVIIGECGLVRRSWDPRARMIFNNYPAKSRGMSSDT